MIDQLDFEAPYGRPGDIVARFFLKPYLSGLLITRNNVIKDYAESEKWKTLLLMAEAPV